MTNDNEYRLKGQQSLSRRKLAWYIVWRSVAIGLLSGSVLGVLFGFGFIFAFIWTGIVGAGLGLGLGLVNGLLLSLITCLFFYPLKHVRLYYIIAKVISAAVAGIGVAGFGPWYFSSTVMTPSSAVLIGFGSVLASAIAALAGWLAGENISQWYERKTKAYRREATITNTQHSTINPNQADQNLEAALVFSNWAWVSLGILSLLSLFAGTRLLQFLVCGTQNIVSCLPSSRLYTSVIAGFKVVLPVLVVVILLVEVLRSLYNNYNR